MAKEEKANRLNREEAPNTNREAKRYGCKKERRCISREPSLGRPDVRSEFDRMKIDERDATTELESDGVESGLSDKRNSMVESEELISREGVFEEEDSAMVFSREGVADGDGIASFEHGEFNVGSPTSGDGGILNEEYRTGGVSSGHGNHDEMDSSVGPMAIHGQSCVTRGSTPSPAESKRRRMERNQEYMPRNSRSPVPRGNKPSDRGRIAPTRAYGKYQAPAPLRLFKEDQSEALKRIKRSHGRPLGFRMIATPAMSDKRTGPPTGRVEPGDRKSGKGKQQGNGEESKRSTFAKTGQEPSRWRSSCTDQTT